MLVIGHRGAAELAPENTWQGFDVALGLGVDVLETDVRATSDGRLVLIHDETLDRTTNGTGLVRGTPWSIVRALDAGSWFGDQFRGARVPLLGETLERYGWRTRLDLEIKQPGIELDVLHVVRDLDLVGRVTFTSFVFDVVQRIKAQAPDAKVGFLTADVGESSVMRAVLAHLDQFLPPASAVTADFVSRCKDLGLEVRAWQVTDEDVMMQVLRAGAYGMSIDSPDVLLKVLGRGGTS